MLAVVGIWKDRDDIGDSTPARKARPVTVLADSDALIEVFRRRNQDIAAHGAKIWTRNRKHYPMQDLAFF